MSGLPAKRRHALVRRIPRADGRHRQQLPQPLSGRKTSQSTTVVGARTEITHAMGPRQRGDVQQHPGGAFGRGSSRQSRQANVRPEGKAWLKRRHATGSGRHQEDRGQRGHDRAGSTWLRPWLGTGSHLEQPVLRCPGWPHHKRLESVLSTSRQRAGPSGTPRRTASRGTGVKLLATSTMPPSSSRRTQLNSECSASWASIHSKPAGMAIKLVQGRAARCRARFRSPHQTLDPGMSLISRAGAQGNSPASLHSPGCANSCPMKSSFLPGWPHMKP